MITRVAGSALRLERLDELFGEKQQGESRRIVLLDRNRPSVEAGAPRVLTPGREPRPADQGVPDRQHDAEVDAWVSGA
jgi:hypothetical protein